MNKHNCNGVLPLVCAVCERPVGVINTDALAALLNSSEIYICTTCQQRPETDVVSVLAAQPPEHYVHLVTETILDNIPFEGYANGRA